MLDLPILGLAGVTDPVDGWAGWFRVDGSLAGRGTGVELFWWTVEGWSTAGPGRVAKPLGQHR